MSSAAGSRSHAKTCPLQESKPESMVNAPAYGQSSPELLASFDPDTRSLRTSQLSLLETEAGGLTEYSSTWPKSGLMRNGTAYRLQRLVPHTGGTGFGSSPTHSVPTPTTQDHIERECTSTEALNFKTNKSVSLDRFVGVFPTPASRDYKAPNKKPLEERLQTNAGEQLPNHLKHKMGVEGQLNPAWVCWLMGLPLDYLDLDGYQNPELEGLPQEYLIG